MQTKAGVLVVRYSLREKERGKREFVWERERECVCVCIYAKEGCLQAVRYRLCLRLCLRLMESAREREIFFCMCACMYVCARVGEGGVR